MDPTHIAPVPNARNEAAGTALAMLVIAAFALVFFPLTLLAIAAVRSVEVAPRAIHAVGRLFRREWDR